LVPRFSPCQPRIVCVGLRGELTQSCPVPPGGAHLRWPCESGAGYPARTKVIIRGHLAGAYSTAYPCDASGAAPARLYHCVSRLTSRTTHSPSSSRSAT